MEKSEQITQITKDLFTELGFQVSVSIKEESSMYNVQVTTDDDAPLLIGRHAHMLGALQRVLSAMLFKKMQEKVDVLLDINDYRGAQKERLAGIADNIARRVIDEQRESRMLSFSSYERRIIHEHIANNYQSLTSNSEGEGRDRVLVVSLKE